MCVCVRMLACVVCVCVRVCECINMYMHMCVSVCNNCIMYLVTMQFYCSIGVATMSTLHSYGFEIPRSRNNVDGMNKAD